MWPKIAPTTHRKKNPKRSLHTAEEASYSDGVYLVCVINSCQGIRCVQEGGGMRGTPSGGVSAVSLLRLPGAWKRDKNRNTGGRLEEERRGNNSWQFPLNVRKHTDTVCSHFHYVTMDSLSSFHLYHILDLKSLGEYSAEICKAVTQHKGFPPSIQMRKKLKETEMTDCEQEELRSLRADVRGRGVVNPP